jgi:hypothetical protein
MGLLFVGMKFNPRLSVILALASLGFFAHAQDATPAAPRADFRSSLAVIDDATVDASLQPPLPPSGSQLLTTPTVNLLQNQLLLEPAFTLRYRSRWSLAGSAVGRAESFDGLSAMDFDLPPGNAAAATALNAALEPFTGTKNQLLVKEAYVGLSAGDFDFTVGRRMVRWGTGYAFTAAGVLDPPRNPTNPTDRLNLNVGRDMVKADFVHGQQALQVAWSSAMLAPSRSNLHDTTAFRYNVLVHGFDTSLLASHDRGGDTEGALTFTRVLGQAWELHGEAAWREQAAVLVGGKFMTTGGISFIAEFFAPPNTVYFRDTTVSPLAGRQHYAFFDVSKSRLRERPGWKEWDLGAYVVTNLGDHSATTAFDVTRRFGNHLSSYVHGEFPTGSKSSEYGATPYVTAFSMGVRFQL